MLRKLTRQEGATAVEYAVFVALIAAAAIIAVSLLGESTNEQLECAELAISLEGYCTTTGFVCTVKGKAAKSKKCKNKAIGVEDAAPAVFALGDGPLLFGAPAWNQPGGPVRRNITRGERRPTS